MIAPFLASFPRVREHHDGARADGEALDVADELHQPAEDESSGTGDTPGADSEKMGYEAAASLSVVLRPVLGGRMKAVTVAPGTAGSMAERWR